MFKRGVLLLTFVSMIPAHAAAPKKGNLDELHLVEGDETGNEVKSLKAELLVSQSEKNAVIQAQRLLKKYKNTPMEPEIAFRLAELYMRRAKTDRFFEVHRESDTVVKLAPRLVKEASSRATIQSAIDAYADIQKRFPEFSQMDLVIFNHAFASQSLGQEKEAEGLYQSLINAHASSPLVPDAHLAIGEISFTRGQFPVALDHFNAIRKYPESRVYPYGLYKSAWTLYNMRDAEKALKKLEEVVAFGRFVAETHVDARLDLRKEALNDMTLFYEDVFPAKDAFAYFKTQAGPEEVGPIVLRMANLYERHSRFNDQRVALLAFAEQLPKSPLLPKINVDLILTFDHLKEKDHAVERLTAFAELCRPDGGWAKAQAPKDPKAKKVGDVDPAACGLAFDDVAQKMARKWLRAWKKLPGDTSYADAAEKAFALYLKKPQASDEFAESRFAYADLLFARKKFREASAQYAQVSPTAKVHPQASYGAVVSLEKAVGDTWSAEDEKTFARLGTAYVTSNPRGEFRLDVEYKMALLAYEKNRYDEAAPIFLKLGREFSANEKGVKSQDLYLDILNLKKDYRGIREYAQNLLSAKPPAARDLKVRRIAEQAYFLEIQNLEEKGQFLEALREYQNFARQNPNSEFTETAMFNTFQLQYRLNQTSAGAQTAEAFADQFPKSPKAPDALARAAASYEQAAQLRPAARVLEKMAAREPANQTKWRELAADFYALDGDANGARRIYKELKLVVKLEALERDYGTDATRAEIRAKLIEQNVQPYAARAQVERIEAMQTAGRDADAFNEARRLLGGGVPNEEKARLRLVQAKVLQGEFERASVKSRAERVVQVLAIKTEKLQKAQEALQSAIKYGNAAVSMEAFERLYAIYDSYVKAIKNMPTPAGLSDADAQAFRGELQNLVIPLEEKSVDALNQAVQFARKQNALNDTLDRLTRQLASVNQQSTVSLAPALISPPTLVPVLKGAH